MNIRALAIYLPQFHPITENNEWWGTGFTEWTNVTKAVPRFKGHYQPHLPSDTGFYDLRVAETRQQQAELAREYGIEGFCYYHYWFNGRRILERPFEEVLSSGQPDFPFCLCWANENWTRRWDGRDNEVLLEQVYSEDDDRAHLRSLEKSFRDPRYIRVDGKPVFIVYRISSLPEPIKTVAAWRDEARKLGIGELYLMHMDSYAASINPSDMGLDAAIEFQPDWVNQPKREQGKFKDRFLSKLHIKKSAFWHDNIIDYSNLVATMMEKPQSPYKIFPGITPSWDNSARRAKDAYIFINSSPEKYGEWLNHIVKNFKPFSAQENFLFINAWNEWAEGNHLEPCRKWGRGYLEQTKKALSGG